MLQEVATGSLCFSCSSCMKRGFSSCLKQELPQLFAKSLWGMKRMLRPFPRLWTSLELAVTGEGRAHCLVPVAAGTVGWWLGGTRWSGPALALQADALYSCFCLWLCSPGCQSTLSHGWPWMMNLS